jgi:predicted signal transduction protein with EAL and GGDEF domain
MLCERLLQGLRARSFDADGTRVRITASLGYVALPLWSGHEQEWETALRLVDHAVYCSKAEGRDRWTGFVGAHAPSDPAGMTSEALEIGGHVIRRRAQPEA